MVSTLKVLAPLGDLERDKSIVAINLAHPPYTDQIVGCLSLSICFDLEH